MTDLQRTSLVRLSVMRARIDHGDNPEAIKKALQHMVATDVHVREAVIELAIATVDAPLNNKSPAACAISSR